MPRINIQKYFDMEDDREIQKKYRELIKRTTHEQRGKIFELSDNFTDSKGVEGWHIKKCLKENNENLTAIGCKKSKGSDMLINAFIFNATTGLLKKKFTDMIW